MNEKHLIIVILSIIIVFLCCGIGYMLLGEHTQYVTTTIGESGTTFEIPNDMAIKSNDSENGILVLENDNTIIVIFNSENKGLAPLMSFATIKNPLFGNEYSGNITLNNPSISGCSLDGQCNGIYIGNNDTHDNIIVVSKSKNIVNHIIDSIIWGKKPVSTNGNNEAASSDSSSSQPSAYAYKSDGTPMYSQDEVNDYMLNKYGMVDYHVGDNGYIDMDEPGYDDAGNWVGDDEK